MPTPRSCCLAALLLSASALRADAPPIAASVDVRLVTIEVHAADASGHAVGDLTRDDFTLAEDGKPTEIGTFEAPRTDNTGKPASAAPSSGASSPEEGTPLHLAIFVDNTHLSPASRSRALTALGRFLAERLPPGTEVSLATLDAALQVRVPFTTKIGAVIDALAEIRTSMASLVTMAIDRRQTLAAILQRQQLSLETPFDTPCPSDLALFARQQSDAEQASAVASLEALGVFVNSLVSMPGRKVLLHVSDGVPLIAGMEGWNLANRLCDGSGAREGIQFATDVVGQVLGDHYDPSAAWSEMQTYSTRPLVDAAVRAAVAHGVEIYTLQARGMARDTDGIEFSGRINDLMGESSEAANLTDTLTALAHDTGGMALIERNDLGGALDDLARDVEHVYVLGFYPTRSGDDRMHRVEVRSKRSGVVLRYPRTYRDTAPDTVLSERVLAALLQRDNHEALGVEVQAVQAARLGAAPGATAAARGTVVQINVPLSRITSLEQGGGQQRQLSLFVGVRREDGAITAVRRKTVTLSTPSGAILPPFYRYEIRVDLPAGVHTVAVAVRDDIAGTIDLRSIAIKVPKR